MSLEDLPVSRAEFEALKAELHELRLSRLQKTVLTIRRKRRAIVAALTIGILIPAAISALSITKSHTFTAGNPTVASEVNTNFDQLFTKVNDLAAYHPPIGSIIGWHKSMTGGTPALPASGEWVECNGQILSDGQSPYNGQVIPNLNGSAGGVDSPGQAAKVQMFLRGGTTSGTGQADAFQGHYHASLIGDFNGNSTGSNANSGANVQATQSALTTGAPANDGTNGVPRTASETRPANMSVVWIIKVK